MTPERIARLVARWARLYTRGLPAPTAKRRIDEIDADLHDHIAHERARGASDRRIATGITSRMIRGMAADVSWRRRESGRPPFRRSVVRVALVTTCVLMVPLVGMQLSEDVVWSVADFAGAAVLIAGSGLLIELALRNPRSRVYRVLATALGAAAIVFGNADDAPGLVLFGLLLILGTIALTLRTATRSA